MHRRVKAPCSPWLKGHEPWRRVRSQGANHVPPTSESSSRGTLAATTGGKLGSDQLQLVSVMPGVVRQVMGAIGGTGEWSEARQFLDMLPNYNCEETDEQMMSMIQGVVRQVVNNISMVEDQSNIGEFLSKSASNHYAEGRSLVTDMMMALANCLVFKDLVDLISSTPSPSTMARLQGTLRQFITEKVLKDSEASKGSIDSALSLIATDWFSQVVKWSCFDCLIVLIF